MTRTRKLTLSVKEFSHLVSESLDMASTIPSSHSLVDATAVFSEISPKPHPRRPSSFQRIFSRPTLGQHEDSPQGPPEDLSETPRKMITWPFSRSPRKNRPTGDDDNVTQEVKDPNAYHSTSPYSVTSFAAGSTSSLGSLIPAHERLFQVTSRDSDVPNQNSSLFKLATPSRTSEPPTGPGRYTAAITWDEVFGNGSATTVHASTNHSVVEPASDISNQSRTSFEGTEATHSVGNSEPESFDEDPTPRASTFGPRAALPRADIRNDPVLAQRGRSQHLSLVVPSRNVDVLALRPAVGVAPHAPSETDSSASACSTSSPTSPVARSSSPTFPMTRPSGSETSSPRVAPFTPPNPRAVAVFPDISASNQESLPVLGYSPRQRKRAMSRSMTPPLPRPPPTGPLPAVPLSVPPVPPLPPLLHKISMNMTPDSVISSPPRSTNLATALPPSTPGGLRLPSRLSWASGVRAVLPSPPASPTKSFKSLAGRTPLPLSPSKAEKKRPHELKRPTSIGVIEAADNVQVRRTKSILLLGSRSKSNASLGTKRVQIHADVNLDAGESRKPRRKSSAATVGYPISSSDFGPVITPMPSSELLVPRERRHSAPMLSTLDSKALGVSSDWTLSLPFCTDVPGNKIIPSPLLTPQLKSEHDLEEVQGDDWTLCMPLKIHVDTPTVETTEGHDSERTLAKTSEGAEARNIMQLPTPSPSPTRSTPPSVIRPLDPEDSVPTPADRPASPASLGPHVGGLDLAGGCGKRASGWHVYGWFDEVIIPEDQRRVASTAAIVSDSNLVKSHVTAFRKTQDACGRHPSQDSMSTMSTSETMFYSARSSLLVN
ncbi:hypothetical protein J3R82DRAFT_2918 [Butyriboletus roseoflavus]|nr:hypothetical protein J3R82DRAFT_2918 [Butyriboletus roseoflavus]